MSTSLPPLRLIAVAILMLLLPAHAYADGVYFPERAYRKLPEIPSQRAILSYRDGVETLIVESALRAEGQSFGWIIPLPAEPTEIKKVPTELLNVFSSNTQPEIIHKQIKPLVIAFLAVTLFFLTYILFEVRWRDLLAISIGLLFIYGIFGARLGTKGVSIEKKSARIEGIDIRKHVDIGSYEVTVLKAARTDDLNEWLEKNDFIKIPSTGDSIVNDYIRKNWVFVAAKLKRSEGGFSIPHPLLLKFSVSKSVYPMRLTALAGSDLFLKLFVVGNQEAAFSPDSDELGLEKPILEYADRYAPLDEKTAEIYFGYKQAYKIGEYAYPIFQGEGFQEFISHPIAQEILWPSCVITSFAGKISPEDMIEDYLIDFSGFEKFQIKYFSSGGAIAEIFPYALAFWALALMASSLMFTRKGRRYVFTRIILLSLCICILGSIIGYSTLPVIKVRTAKGGPRSTSQDMAGFHIWRLRDSLAEYKEDTGRYPTTLQGLDALAKDPGVKGWNGPYLERFNQTVPKDPWSNPYHYQSPAQHVEHGVRPQDNYKDYDLFSYGEDNEPGGAGLSEDRTSWD